MKKIFCPVFFAFLMLWVCAISVSAAETIDVGLTYGEQSLQSVTLSGERLCIPAVSEREFTEVIVSVSQTDNGTGFVIQSNDGLVTTAETSSALCFSDEADHIISVNGKEYAGEILVRFRADATLDIINRVEIETYLCGVLPYEMSTGWPAEALKAQAVAARNYVANNLKKHQADGYNLCNTTHCQVYRGVSGQAADCTQAVLDTAGVYLYYQGNLAQTFYFSSSGGKTENVKDVWGSSFPYLVSVDDPYEKTEEISSANWKYTVSKTELKNLFSSYGVGDITDLIVTQRTEGGRAKTLSVVGTEKTVEISATEFRTLVGASLIKGTFFEISKNGSDTLKAITQTQTDTVQGSVYALSSTGEAVLCDVKCIQSESAAVPYTTSFESLSFVGKGYGHGVGMSQWGARGMAEAGFKYDEILKHYFTNTELKTKE